MNRTFEDILESYHVTLEENRRDESIALAAEEYANQFKNLLTEIENLMERWNHARDNDNETVGAIDKLLK